MNHDWLRFLVPALLVFTILSCGGTEEGGTLRLQIELPADWESLLDMEVLGAPVQTPYIGTIRIVVENGGGTDMWEFPWGDRSGSFRGVELGGGSRLRIEAVTAGTVIMEKELNDTADGDITVTLRESGGFSAAGSLLHYRQEHSAVAVGDTIFVVGGNLGTRVIETVVPSGEGFTANAYAASLVYARSGQDVLYDPASDRLFVFKGAMPVVEDNLYEMVTLQSKLTAPKLLSNFRCDFVPVFNSSNILLLGGYDDGQKWQDNTLVINSQTLSEYVWTGMGSSEERYEPSCVIESSRIACFGGSTNIIEVFNINTGDIEFSSANYPLKYNFSLIPLQNGELLISGGREGVDILSEIETYNVMTGNLDNINSDLVHPRYLHSATYIGLNKILIIGGGSTLETSRTAEILDLETGESTQLPWRMRVPRVGHTATRLPDGRVMVIGGSMGDKRIEVWNPPYGLQ